MAWKTLDGMTMSPAERQKALESMSDPVLVSILSYFAETDTTGLEIRIPQGSPLRTTDAAAFENISIDITEALDKGFRDALELLILAPGQLPPTTAIAAGPQPSLYFEFRLHGLRPYSCAGSVTAVDPTQLRRQMANGASLGQIVSRVRGSGSRALEGHAVRAALARGRSS